METKKNFKFKVEGIETPITIESKNEKAARSLLIRRRHDYRTSYAKAYQAELISTEEQGNPELIKAIFEGLQAETVSFKEEYLNRVETYERDRINNLLERLQGCETHENLLIALPTIERRGRACLTLHSQKIASDYWAAKAIVKNGRLSNHLSTIRETASRSFDEKLFKLASRIEGKGLNAGKLEITSKHIDVNFDCWITDGTQGVHAWTIIASGPVQRPHYRYLIK